jgi:hypothetical protein
MSSRGLGAFEHGETSTQKNLYAMVQNCDKVLCF